MEMVQSEQIISEATWAVPHPSGDLHVKNFPVVMGIATLLRCRSVGIFDLNSHSEFAYLLNFTFVTHRNIKSLLHLIGQSREYSTRKFENSKSKGIEYTTYNCYNALGY